MTTPDSSLRLSRREVLKFFTAASAVLTSGKVESFAQELTVASAKGYGTDPDLTKIYSPGDVWPLTFTPEQRKAATAMADVLFPADQFGPAASALRVPDFIDEWISAPYERQQKDRSRVIEGLAWLDEESKRRSSKTFAELAVAEQTAIVDDICDGEKATPAFKKANGFFNTFRSIAGSAYYSTPEGWKALGYIGNVPTPTFDGPPAEVLQRLGLTQIA